jgi:hypothetical protein
VARVAKGELWLSHPYNAQTLDDHLVDGCAYRCAAYLPLKKLNTHSKNPGCGCELTCTGFAFFLSIFVGAGGEVGEGVAINTGVNVSVGIGLAVGILVDTLVGIFVGGVLLNVAFL